MTTKTKDDDERPKDEKNRGQNTKQQEESLLTVCEGIMTLPLKQYSSTLSKTKATQHHHKQCYHFHFTSFSIESYNLTLNLCFLLMIPETSPQNGKIMFYIMQTLELFKISHVLSVELMSKVAKALHALSVQYAPRLLLPLHDSLAVPNLRRT